MAKVQIKVNDNGSLRITGDVELLDGEGKPRGTKQTFS
ncbi:CDGSH iron-sulfur domain-containing protein, partial [Geobacillus thermodenitrificans]